MEEEKMFKVNIFATVDVKAKDSENALDKVYELLINNELSSRSFHLELVEDTV